MAIAVVYNVTDIAGIPTLLASVASQLGPVTILVNSAGIALISTLDHHGPGVAATWEKVITTNLTGPAAFMCSVLPAMLAHGRGTILG